MSTLYHLLLLRNTIITIIKQGSSTEYIDFTADYELQQILLNNNVDNESMKKLYAIKHVVPMIINLDIDGFKAFSRYFCDGETYEIASKENQLYIWI